MSDDHIHSHEDLFKQAVTREVANSVKNMAPWLLRHAIHGALTSTVGALRERSYEFAPIDPTKLLADPHPLDVRGTDLPSRMGVVLHDRLLYTSNSYLAIVRYYADPNGDNTLFNIAVTRINEEQLSSAPSLNFPTVIRDEISRQVATMPPMATDSVRLVGVTISDDFFSEETINTYWYPAGGEPAAVIREREAQAAVAAGLPIPEAEKPFTQAADITPAHEEFPVTRAAAVAARPAMPKAQHMTASEVEQKKLDPTVPRATPADQIPTLRSSVATHGTHSAPDVQLSANALRHKASRPVMPKGNLPQ